MPRVLGARGGRIRAAVASRAALADAALADAALVSAVLTRRRDRVGDMWSCCPCYASASDYTLARAPTSDMLDTAFNAEDDSEDEDEYAFDAEPDADISPLRLRQSSTRTISDASSPEP